MNFILKMSVDNDAFTPQPYEEAARILRMIADRLDTVRSQSGNVIDGLGDYTDSEGGWTGYYQTIRDINGNDVGRYAFKEKE